MKIEKPATLYSNVVYSTLTAQLTVTWSHECVRMGVCLCVEGVSDLTVPCTTF